MHYALLQNLEEFRSKVNIHLEHRIQIIGNQLLNMQDLPPPGIRIHNILQELNLIILQLHQKFFPLTMTALMILPEYVVFSLPVKIEFCFKFLLKKEL
jgi:hypothetical protein